MFKRFGSRRHVILGLDIRPGGLRYACVRSDRHGITLIHQGDWEGDSTDEGFFRMAEAAQASLERRRIRPERIIVGLPRQWCFLKILTMPRMPAEDVRNALAFELEKHLPVAPESLIYDHMVLGEESGPDMDLLVGAVRRDIIESILSAWRAKGLEPEALVPSPFASGELLARCQPEVSGAPQILLVEEDEQSVGVDVYEKGRLASSQLFSLEGRDGPEAIASLQQELYQGLSSILSRLESPADLPWFFLGPLESVVRQALQTLGLASPTAVDHRAIIQSPEGVDIEPFHTAAGLAFLGHRGETIPINLVPPPTEAPPARRVPLRAVALGVALVGALGLYVATTVRDGWELRRLKDAVAALRPKVENVNLLQRESSQLRTEKDALESMSTRNPSILQLLRELTLIIPASAWLTDTNYNGRELVIGGYAQSSLELIGLLEESPRFSNVEFRGTITKRNDKERFKISAQIE